MDSCPECRKPLVIFCPSCRGRAGGSSQSPKKRRSSRKNITHTRNHRIKRSRNRATAPEEKGG